MEYLKLFDAEFMNYQNPAEHLLQVLRKKWALETNDKDMIVMQHKFNYSLSNKTHDLKLSMVVKGDDSIQTGMAKTVGLPVFFACKLILENKINLKGVRIPIYQEIYKPILQKLTQKITSKHSQACILSLSMNSGGSRRKIICERFGSHNSELL